MQLRELTAFQAVAMRSSFSRAAMQLGYAQSTISAQIQSLETELGVTLFDRLGRRIALTAAGEALLPYAQQLAELHDEARDAVTAATSDRGALAGSVSLSAPESLLTYRLPAVLASFRGRHPGVVIAIHPTPIGRFRGDTRRAVTSGAVQLAFVLDTPLDMGGFESEVLVREPIDVIAPPGHPLAGSGRTSPESLDGETILYPEAPDRGCVYRGQFERHLTDRHVSPGTSLEFASIETVKQCVASGMGISALLSEAVRADVETGRVARLDWREPFETYTQMVWNTRRSISPALAALMDTAREVVQGRD